MDNLAPAKTIKKSIDKMRNLKDVHKRAKESNKKNSAAPRFPPYFTETDEIGRCRDALNLPEKTEVGTNSIFDDEINVSSDWESDVNKSNVLKQVLKKILAKGFLKTLGKSLKKSCEGIHFLVNY